MTYSIMFGNLSQDIVNPSRSPFYKHNDLGKTMANGLIEKFQKKHPEKTIVTTKKI